MSEPGRHSDRCVCTECMRAAFPGLRLPTLDEALAAERGRERCDSIVRLDKYQRKLLDTFAKRWNADRLRRGKRPLAAHDALTQGLESLIAMIGQE